MTSWLLHQKQWRYNEDAMTSWLLHLLCLRWNPKWQHHQMLVRKEDYLMVGRLIVYCEWENACHAFSCGVYVWPTWWRSDHTGDTCILPVFSSALPCLRPLSSLLLPWRIELMQQRRRGPNQDTNGERWWWCMHHEITLHHHKLIPTTPILTPYNWRSY